MRFGATSWRRQLFGGLRAAVEALKGAGCRTAYIDGSFVTAKEVPGDFDGCWDTAEVNPTALDPVLLTFSSSRAAQKAKFGGEMFPSSSRANPEGQTFFDFFQVDKETGKAKGIIGLDLRSL